MPPLVRQFRIRPVNACRVSSRPSCDPTAPTESAISHQPQSVLVVAKHSNLAPRTRWRRGWPWLQPSRRIEGQGLPAPDSGPFGLLGLGKAETLDPPNQTPRVPSGQHSQRSPCSTTVGREQDGPVCSRRENKTRGRFWRNLGTSAPVKQQRSSGSACLRELGTDALTRQAVQRSETQVRHFA